MKKFADWLPTGSSIAKSLLMSKSSFFATRKKISFFNIFFIKIWSYGLKPAEISVQDVDLLEDELCSLLACSTRALISKLNGEQNAQFLANMAPFNVKYVFFRNFVAKIVILAFGWTKKNRKRWFLAIKRLKIWSRFATES